MSGLTPCPSIRLPRGVRKSAKAYCKIAQVNDDARRVAHRAQGSAELSQDRNGKKIKAYVTDVLSQSPRFKLDKERRERLHGRRHLAFESLASDAHAMHTVERVEIRDAR